jgi:hypothetical protein
MTKEDAKNAMKSGQKVTHRYFSPEEFVTSNADGSLYTFEDGCTVSEELFWQDRSIKQWDSDWSIYNDGI